MAKSKFNFKGLGMFLITVGVVYSLIAILMCQVEFGIDLDITISKKKTGIIQSLTNVADVVYGSYKSLTKGAL